MSTTSRTVAPVRIAPSLARALDERTAADALRPPVSERPADLLFEGQEEAGAGNEDEAPERAEGRVLLRAQSLVRHDDEQVRGDRGDAEAGTDDEGPFGDGAAGLLDQLA